MNLLDRLADAEGDSGVVAIEADDTAGPLPPEVRTAYLADYPQRQLEARKLFYEREVLFERDPAVRRALREELERTQHEIARRAVEARAEAERVFT